MDAQGASENITLGSAERIPELGAGREANTRAWQEGRVALPTQWRSVESFCFFFHAQVAPSSRAKTGKSIQPWGGSTFCSSFGGINTDCSSQLL